MTIELYSGEFTISPIPLEMSLNYCSHRCAFCFANLNNPEREADIPAIMRTLRDYKQRKGPEATLLKAGYPVLVSNRVDAFATSNSKQALTLLEVMTELGIPVAFQTRGGRGIDEALGFLPPSCWYVSICQMNDDIRRRIEPGAPSIEERFRLIERLVNAGHRVSVGLNPYVPEWLPDAAPLFQRAKAAGAEGVWVDLIHLSKDQAASMPERDRANMGLALLETTQRRRPSAEELAAHQRALVAAAEAGLETYSVGHSHGTRYWEPYGETYANTFPTTQDVVNACWESLEDGAILDFATFLSFFEDLPQLAGADTYLRAKSRGGRLLPELTHSGRLRSGMTFPEVLEVIWAETRISLCPARLSCFAYAAERDEEGWHRYLDAAGRPILVFSRAGFAEYCTEVREAA